MKSVQVSRLVYFLCFVALLGGACHKEVEPAYQFERLGRYRGVFGIVPTADGGFLIGTTQQAEYRNQQNGGTTSANILSLLKTNAAGDVLWRKAFPQQSDMTGRAMVALSDGHLLVAADATPTLELRGSGGSLTKFTPEGELVWSRRFHTETEVDVHSLLIGKAGEVYVSGYDIQPGPGLKSGPATSRGWVVQADTSGRFRWEYMAAASTSTNYITPMALTTDGSLITLSASGTNSMVVRQFKGTNSPRLLTTLPGLSDVPQLLQTTPSDHILLAGTQVSRPTAATTIYQTALWRIDPTGQSVTTKAIGADAVYYLQFDRLASGSYRLITSYANTGKLGFRWQWFTELGEPLTETILYTDDKRLLEDNGYFASRSPTRGRFCLLSDDSAVLAVSEIVDPIRDDRLLKMYWINPDGTRRWVKTLEP